MWEPYIILILHELSFKFGFILADWTNWFNFVNFDWVQSFVVECFLKFAMAGYSDLVCFLQEFNWLFSRVPRGLYFKKKLVYSNIVRFFL